MFENNLPIILICGLATGLVCAYLWFESSVYYSVREKNKKLPTWMLIVAGRNKDTGEFYAPPKKSTWRELRITSIAIGTLMFGWCEFDLIGYANNIPIFSMMALQIALLFSFFLPWLAPVYFFERYLKRLK
jgi:hypothetical protein